MPIVHVYMWPGRDAGEKRRIIEGMTGVLTDMGIPAQAVRVLVHDVPKDSWGGGGVPASEWEM